MIVKVCVKPAALIVSVLPWSDGSVSVKSSRSKAVPPAEAIHLIPCVSLLSR